VPDSVIERLSSLPGLSKRDLCRLWQELFQSEPPSLIQKALMVRIIGYRLQEQAFGGLSAASRRRLLDLARQFESNPNASPTTVLAVKPGTRLFRQWKERTHVVTVEPNSFEYGGSQYTSLSQIARLITGTNWSGPLFFGLKQRQVETSQKETV
jgi:Protein of unknown function (DUF2924)